MRFIYLGDRYSAVGALKTDAIYMSRQYKQSIPHPALASLSLTLPVPPRPALPLPPPPLPHLLTNPTIPHPRIPPHLHHPPPPPQHKLNRADVARGHPPTPRGGAEEVADGEAEFGAGVWGFGTDCAEGSEWIRVRRGVR